MYKREQQNKQTVVSRRCDKWMPHAPHVETGKITRPQASYIQREVTYDQCDGQGYGVEAWPERRCVGRLAHAGHSWTVDVSADSTATAWCTGQITGPAPDRLISPIEGRYEP